MAHRILGLDIGAAHVKAVLAESSYRGFNILAAASARVPSEGPTLRERQLIASKAIVADATFAFDSAIVALPGVSATHLISLPFSDQRRIEQTIAFEVEDQIPFDLSEVAWDWQPLRIGEGKSELLVSVVKRDELSTLLASLGGIGVDPRAVVPPGPVYAALFGAGVLGGDFPTPSSDPAFLGAADAVLDVGASRASLCVVAGGVCEAARTFPVGSVPAIAREVRSSLRAWRGRSASNSQPVRRLLIAGGARPPGLAEALAPEVGGVESLSLCGPVAEKIGPEDARTMALALALALRGHQGWRAPRLNLRRGDLAYTRDFARVRGKVLRLGTWAALVVLLAMVSCSVKVFALSHQEKLLDQALCDTTQRLLGKCYENDELAVAALRGKGTLAGSVPKNSALDIFTELSVRSPPDISLRYDRLEISREKLHLQGVTDAAENVDRIVSALRASPCFGDARSGAARKRSGDGKFEFTIDSALTCDTGTRSANKG